MSNKKVLIIDDEEDFCLLLQGYLKRKAFDVTVSNTLKEGMRKFGELCPDVLFLDNNLPDGLGWEQLPRFAAQHPNTQFYLVSAYHPTLPPVQENTVVKVFEKPISFRDLDQFL